MFIPFFAITTAIVMCANSQLESSNADKGPIVSIQTESGVIDYEGQIKEGLRVRIRGDIGSSRPIYTIVFYYENGLDYSVTLCLPANIDHVTPSAIQCHDDLLNIMDEQGRIILSINYRIIEHLKRRPYPSRINLNDYMAEWEIYKGKSVRTAIKSLNDVGE